MNRAQEMRAEFDRSFAEAPRTQQLQLQDFLAIQVGGEPYAVRLTEVHGLFADRRITCLPTSDPTFLGIAGLRGAVVPVYDLAALLGHPAAGASRWLLLIGSGALALAFAAFDGHLRLPQAAVAAQLGQGRSGNFIREMLHVGGSARPIVQLTAIFQSIEQGAPRRDQHQES